MLEKNLVEISEQLNRALSEVDTVITKVKDLPRSIP